MHCSKIKSISEVSSFTPSFKRKRFASNKTPTHPLPVYPLETTGTFTGFSVEINNPEHIRRLFDEGCFGKGSKSRSCPEFIKQKQTLLQFEDVSLESLLLDLEEAFFLSHILKVLKILDMNGMTLSSDDLISKFSKIKPYFVESLVAYLYLRSKNWIVRSGTKFGANFLIYKKGLRYYHASFIVVINKVEPQFPKDVKGLQRIAETSDKDVLFLEISKPKEIKNILNDLNKFSVTESIIKRFNYSAYVQLK